MAFRRTKGIRCCHLQKKAQKSLLPESFDSPIEEESAKKGQKPKNARKRVLSGFLAFS
jgi:hypothetical protein